MKKNKIKPVLHLLLCLLIAWMITNGWAYVCLGLGLAFDWAWAKGIGTAYLAFLWMPWTPEKLITIPIAIFLQHLIFPQDKAIGRWLKIKFKELKKKLSKGKKLSLRTESEPIKEGEKNKRKIYNQKRPRERSERRDKKW